jgi:signal transduction histidine kinase/CheY-like chemotaxis protein/purine-cytosine permease-like protein
MQRQRIIRIRRDYNQWVTNQTLEDYALRFTAKSARKWSAARVANTALGAISFLALEAIGGTITLGYGFSNAAVAILVVGALIFASGLPIAYYAARYGVDIDLLTRGAGFGYIGSTITSLIYASFTFIFFAIEAAILASMLEICFGVPPWLGYILSSVVVIPMVTHGITFISRLQRWTQPLWAALQILPFPLIVLANPASVANWTDFAGTDGAEHGLNLVMFGACASVVLSLIAQIGEQVDFLRFLPVEKPRDQWRWWAALLSAGPGWILIGAAKMLAGSFLAVLALGNGLPIDRAAQPTEMYRVAFGYVLPSPAAAIVLAAVFVAISQIKINVTNAYAGSIAWSNFFARLTHSHPGRVVWLVFNVAIALLLMEIGIYQAIEHILSLYSYFASAWVGALVADLVVNKPLRLSPPYIEFKRAHLYDVNPVGVGAMALAIVTSTVAVTGALGQAMQAFAPFLAFATAFVTAPLIAWGTRGRYYIARKPRQHWAAQGGVLRCCVCEHAFESADMAYCPAYVGPMCSLCCSLDARCGDSCKPDPQLGAALRARLKVALPVALRPVLTSSLWRYLPTFAVFSAVIGAILFAIYLQAALDLPSDRRLIASSFWKAFCILVPIIGVASWLLVLAKDSRRVAQEESRRQTALLLTEIEAHKRTDAALQKAKEVAESANQAKTHYVVAISHELRTPLNAILGYAQLLERDPDLPERRRDAIRVIRRSGEHLAGLIEGLLDISQIEAKRIEIYRDQVRLREFLTQLSDMFRLQAEAKGVRFVLVAAERLPEVVYADEKRLRQILINLLSNAIKFTSEGSVTLRVGWRYQIAEFEVEDTGPGMPRADLERIFDPFHRLEGRHVESQPGIGLGLTITRLLTQIMGGEVAVTSTLGVGSIFRIRLMLSEVALPEAAAPREREIRGYAGRRLSVLVADDDLVHRSLVKDTLDPLGFTVLTARDGQECLALAATERPNLFLIDLSMPGMDGWELARRLRLAGHEAPVMVISANAGELLARAQAHRDHDDVMAKPIDIATLLEKIRRLLRIDWLVPPGAIAGAIPTTAVRAPAGALSRQQVDELRELCAIGYVRAIRARLNDLRGLDSGLDPFVAHLRALVETFQLKELGRALDTVETDLG